MESVLPAHRTYFMSADFFAASGALLCAAGRRLAYRRSLRCSKEKSLLSFH